MEEKTLCVLDRMQLKLTSDQKEMKQWKKKKNATLIAVWGDVPIYQPTGPFSKLPFFREGGKGVDLSR